VAIGDPFRAALGDQGLGIIYQSLGEMEKARLHNLRGFEQAPPLRGSPCAWLAALEPGRDGALPGRLDRQRITLQSVYAGGRGDR